MNGCLKAQIDLTNTKWEYKLEVCSNIYHFKPDSNFTLYIGCELVDTIFGKYYYVKDTLIVEEIESVFDKLYSTNSPHRLERTQTKFILNKSKLKPVLLKRLEKNEWQTSSFRFPDDYIFTKKK
jgi:hypothetical protein